MLDHRDFAIGNVRIDRNFDGGGMAMGTATPATAATSGMSTSSWHISDIGNFDNFRNAGNLGIVGNVRLRLEQHCFFVDANVNVADNTGRRALEPEFRWDRLEIGNLGVSSAAAVPTMSVSPTVATLGAVYDADVVRQLRSPATASSPTTNTSPGSDHGASEHHAIPGG